MTRSARRILLFLIVWIVAIVAAAIVDRRVAEWVNRARPYNKHDWLVRVLKEFGTFPVALIVGAIVAALRRSWRIIVPFAISGPLVGLAYLLLKWVVGRRRPVLGIWPFDFHPLAHGFGGLIHAENGLSFPSGHAAMAFAAAACLAFAAPRGAVAWFLIAAAVGAERVLENAHYLSDVVAGAGLGVLCGITAIRISGRWVGRAQPRGFSPVTAPAAGDPDHGQSRVAVDIGSVRQ